MSRSFHPIALVLAAVLSLIAAPSLADEVSEVNSLHRSGQTAAALQRAERYIVSRPEDAPMRFLRGVMLADSGRATEAADAFLQLTLDHPQLAEPHNNLGALQAAAGEYDKARLSLEQALRANPDYATAHENLGDVLAVLASQAYNRASRLDPRSSTLQPKMALIRELFRPSNGVTNARKANDQTAQE